MGEDNECGRGWIDGDGSCSLSFSRHNARQLDILAPQTKLSQKSQTQYVGVFTKCLLCDDIVEDVA